MVTLPKSRDTDWNALLHCQTGADMLAACHVIKVMRSTQNSFNVLGFQGGERLLMKLPDTMKRPRTLALALAALLYLWLFTWPKLLPALSDCWSGLRNMLDGDFWGWTQGPVELLCVLGTVIIFFLSIAVTWKAFRKSGKKAYLFILAFFLLQVAQQAGVRATRSFAPPMSVQKLEREVESPILSGDPTGRVTWETPAVQVRVLHVPLGEFFLLAGLWFLYEGEKERSERGEPRTTA